MIAESSLDFPRTRGRTRGLTLTALIDVVFILIIFFMLTTSFMKVESMELLLPAPGTSAPKAASTQWAHIVLLNDGEIRYGRRKVDAAELQRTLTALFAASPDQRIVILSADQVPLQAMVGTMDMVYESGGKSVYIRALPEMEGAKP